MMYCSLCGKKLELKNIHNEGEIPFCKECHKLYFPRIDIAIIAILTNDKSEVCLTNQNKEGKYKVLIAGFVKPNETLEECVIREIKEEVGIDVLSCSYLNSYHYDTNNVLMVGFHAKTSQSDFLIDKEEIDNAAWYDLHDVIGRIREGSIADLLYKQFYQSKAKIEL
ncbi:MAG: NUDIX domain-containing protein [Firmicutes bacterium]|nr:NUDIX domain-containing protein [Bacillota bacterium]